MLVNARQVKNLPGRKSDVPDATSLAQLGAHGLVRGSFVPPVLIRQLRDLTRIRTSVVRERGQEIQRMEKLLEDAGIKLSSVASDISGVSGRAIRRCPFPASGLGHLAAGVREQRRLLRELPGHVLTSHATWVTTVTLGLRRMDAYRGLWNGYS